MLFNIAALAAGASIVAGAAIPAKRAAVTDADILQYALTLEHLENVFYKEALSTWSQEEFEAAGFSAFFYDQLKYVAHDEEAHVVFLETAVKAAGATPVAACTYKFPMADAKAFVRLASTIEGVGVSAYLGASAGITSKAYLTAAASILVTEALHQSAERYAIGEIPMANPLATPLGMNAAYSIASAFIVSCPSTNAALPVMAYKPLTLSSGLPTAEGAMIELKIEGTSAPSGDYFVTFVSGLDVVSVKASSFSNGYIMVPVPTVASGQAYVFLTSDNSGTVTDANVLCGPAIIEVTPSSPTFDISIM